MLLRHRHLAIASTIVSLVSYNVKEQFVIWISYKLLQVTNYVTKFAKLITSPSKSAITLHIGTNSTRSCSHAVKNAKMVLLTHPYQECQPDCLLFRYTVPEPAILDWYGHCDD